jgi:hypothetical protein
LELSSFSKSPTGQQPVNQGCTISESDPGENPFKCWWNSSGLQSARVRWGNLVSYLNSRPLQENFYHPVLDCSFETLQNACETLVELGADVTFVLQVFAAYRQDWCANYWRTLFDKIPPDELYERYPAVEKIHQAIMALRPLLEATFPYMTAEEQRVNLDLLSRLHSQWFILLSSILKAVDPPDHWRELAERASLPDRSPGKPPPVATLFMVLITDHMRERKNKPYYYEVGKIVQTLFRGTLNEKPRVDKENKESRRSRLTRMVMERCKKFKAKHSTECLRAAVIAGGRSLLESEIYNFRRTSTESS